MIKSMWHSQDETFLMEKFNDIFHFILDEHVPVDYCHCLLKPIFFFVFVSYFKFSFCITLWRHHHGLFYIL